MHKTVAIFLLVPFTILFSSFIVPVYGYLDLPWPSFMHDYSHSSLSQYVGTQSNSTLWHFDTKNGSSAIVMGPNGAIYFGSLGSLVALNNDHTEKFRIDVGGIVDTPAVDSNGMAYFENGTSTMFATTQDGTTKWKFQSNGTVTMPALDVYNRLYFGSNTFLESIDHNGKLLWKYNTTGIVSLPSVGPNGMIYAGNTDHNFYSLDPAGNLQWKFNAKGITTLASVSQQGMIYFCDSDSTLYALNPDGTVKWTYPSENAGAPPAIGPDGTLYLPDGTGITAINPDGTTKWKFHPENFTVQSVTVDHAGTVYAGTFENYLFALNSTGGIKWDFKSHGSVGQTIVGPDGVLYFNSGDGSIYALGQAVPEFPLGAVAVMTAVTVLGISLARFQKLSYKI